MTNVANYSFIFHLFHVSAGNNITTTCCSNKDISFLTSFFHRCNLITFHQGLQSTNWIDLRDKNSTSKSTQTLRRPFSNISITSDNSNLPRKHNICRTLDSISKTFTTTVQVVEFRLRYRVIHVDSRNLKSPLFSHLI